MKKLVEYIMDALRTESMLLCKWSAEYLQAAARLAHRALSLFTTTTAHVPVGASVHLWKFPCTPSSERTFSRVAPFSSSAIDPK